MNEKEIRERYKAKERRKINSKNKIKDLPKNVFAHLINLRQLHLDDNQLTTIHSDSFGIHRNLQDIDFENNKINAIDEQFIDNTAVGGVLIGMEGNICTNEVIDARNIMKEKLNNCFKNYQPRGESTDMVNIFN